MFEHIWSGKQVTKRFLGEISIDQIKRSVVAIHGDSRFDDLTHVVLAFSKCETVNLRLEEESATAEIEEIAAISGASFHSNSKIRIAVITEHPEIIKATRIFMDSGLSKRSVEIHQCLDGLKNWLQVSQNCESA